MENKKSLKITVQDKEFTIYTDEDESCIFKAAELLNNLLNDYNQKAPSMSEAKRNLLVALQLATDLTKKNNALENDDLRMQDLNSLINDSL